MLSHNPALLTDHSPHTEELALNHDREASPAGIPAIYRAHPPTLSLGISLSSEPCFRKTLPAFCDGLIPMPSSVMMADVAGGTRNSSAANLSTAVKGVFSGTERTLKGSFGSDV